VTIDEIDLWARARRNDGDAFGALFDLHRDRVYRRALGLLDGNHEVEDVTAAAFFELWRKRASVTPVGGSVLPWLLVTTVNLSRNAHRSTTRYRRMLRSLPRDVAVGAPDHDPEDLRRVRASLAQLSPVDSALFVLTALEDLPIAQAAEAVGLKPATARVRLHRARARLRDDLSDLNPTIRPAIEGNTP
jgi:RNA polymerase sigma factor (sigma-70 family)